MLTIRQDQVDAFERYHLQKFEDEMVEQLRELAPKHWSAIGEKRGRNAIRFGVEQSHKYGFTKRGPVRLYIEMMFTFGTFFDTDPQLPWVGNVLKHSRLEDQMVIADELYEAMEQRFDRIAGPNSEFVMQALCRIPQAAYAVPCSVLEQFDTTMLSRLHEVYPEKANHVGERILRRIIQDGLEIAQRTQLTTDLGRSLLILLMHVLGHGVVVDPVYPWFASAVSQPSATNPEERAQQLLQSIVACHSLIRE